MTHNRPSKRLWMNVGWSPDLPAPDGTLVHTSTRSGILRSPVVAVPPLAL
jgi:hypothetical protein